MIKESSPKKQQPVLSRFIIFSILFFFFILITGSLAFVFSMRQIVRINKGNELSQTLEIERVKLETSVSNEVVIAIKMADSPLIKRYFANPYDSDLRKTAVEEIAAYQNAFASGIIFWISDIDKMFYYNDLEPYLLNPENPENYWYNMTLYETEVYNFNINYNPNVNATNLWINAPVYDVDGKPVGMLGTGIDISTYLDMLNQNLAGRASVYLFNTAGEITGARDIKLVAGKRNIDDEVNIGGSITALSKNLAPYETQVSDTPFGRIAIGTIPLLEWYAVAVMPDSIDDYKTTMTALFIVVLIVIVVIFIIFNFFISRLIRPLRKSMVEADEANHAKSAFLANMSHEMRTPMNVVVGLADLMLEDDDMTDNVKKSIKRISTAGNTLLGLINDILDISKIEAGKLELTPVEYELPSLLNDIITLNMIRVEEKPITFVLDIDDNLPYSLYGDDLRVKQIINNLLSNAFKYTQRGTVMLSMSCGREDMNVRMSICIMDTGIGIREEDQKKLFTEYSQVDTKANRRIEGTGLGLSITKMLVEHMHGEISVESKYGMGTTFRLFIRQGFVSDKVIGAEIGENLRNFRYSDIRKRVHDKLVRPNLSYACVLVVDDMQTNLDVATGMLKKYKMRVDCVTSGVEAINRIRIKEPLYDAIFMDHMMPVMDGIEAAEKIRALGTKYAMTIPIIALTANAIEGNEQMFLSRNFQAFIPKPINIMKLDSIVQRWVRDKTREP